LGDDKIGTKKLMGDSGESNKITEKNKFRVRSKCKV
jgi:hypothetical protein